MKYDINSWTLRVKDTKTNDELVSKLCATKVKMWPFLVIFNILSAVSARIDENIPDDLKNILTVMFGISLLVVIAA
jgi:hypothetical protein